MTSTIIIEGQPFQVIIRRLSHAKRLTLRGEWSTHTLKVTAPKNISQKSIFDFVQRAEGWICAQKAKAPTPLPLQSGMELNILGQKLILKLEEAPPGGKRTLQRTHIDNGYLICYAAIPGRVLPQFLNEHLKAYIAPRLDFYAKELGVSVPPFFLKEFKTRWGSCSQNGTLYFQWKLVFAPLEILEYIIIHEACHLQEFHHGPEFWQLVKQLDPHYAAHRFWLKKHGPQLHALFDTAPLS